MIIKDMSNSEYHALEAISSSACKKVASKSVAHWLGEVRKETPAMITGTAIHSLTLEPHLNQVVRGPETRRGSAWTEALSKAQSINPEALLLPEKEFDAVQDVAQSARANPIMQKYLEHMHSKIEMSVVVTDPDYDLQLRARPDLYNAGDGVMIDLKTCLDASPGRFAKSAYDLGYLLQAAFYKRVLDLEGLKVSDFIFLAVEKDAPYATSAHMLSKEAMAVGEAQMHKALSLIADYKKSGEIQTGWPEIATIYPPSWALEEVEAWGKHGIQRIY